MDSVIVHLAARNDGWAPACGAAGGLTVQDPKRLRAPLTPCPLCVQLRRNSTLDVC